ncbi:FAD/NAD(P)-binding protein [Phytohabitans kaempferiae]|uniref:FAD/NAD(P)-binding protein n=1 Tax=Phytohabitans kaempferiae TaxID=1620943 RepID=A0ABV6MEV9_9ACTN
MRSVSPAGTLRVAATDGGVVDDSVDGRVAVVGAGPVGVGLVERLFANAPSLAPGFRLEIVLIDPYPASAGRVWRVDQSPLMRMNSFARDVTLFPGSSVRLAGPPRPGPALHEWVADTVAGRLPPVADPALDADLADVTPGGFATRRLQGAYLSWFLSHLVEHAPPGVRMRVRKGRATGLSDTADGRQVVVLDDGGSECADVVALALGHLDARPTGEQAELVAFADRHGLVYVPLGYAVDLDLSAIPAGERVIMRGFGLAFFDLMALLTEGRGGRYARGRDGTLEYHASGREPLLYVGSRRGLPYRCKPERRPDKAVLRYLTDGAVGRMVADGSRLSFEGDVWPLVVKELSLAYHRQLFAIRPDLAGLSLQEVQDLLDRAGDLADVTRVSTRAVIAASHRFDMDALHQPLRGHRFDSVQELNDYLCAELRTEIARASDPFRSADLAVYAALLVMFGQLPRLRPLLDGRSRVDLDNAWTRLFDLVVSGPPAFRVEQALALARRGVIVLIGSGMRVRGDSRRGLFRATSANTSSEFVATALVDAFQPALTIAHTADGLLSDLHASGAVTEEVLTDESGHRHSTGRIAVDGDGRLIDAAGRAHPSRFALGWNTSLRGARAFALPGTDAVAFHHADQVARASLRGLSGIQEDLFERTNSY